MPAPFAEIMGMRVVTSEAVPEGLIVVVTPLLYEDEPQGEWYPRVDVIDVRPRTEVRSADTPSEEDPHGK